MGLPDLPILGPHLIDVAGLDLLRQQAGDDAYRPARVGDVDCLPAFIAGWILTAVWTRLVIALPMRSGISRPSRSISDATGTISSREGVIRPERPTMSTSRSRATCKIFVAGTMTPRSIIS